MKYIVKVRNLVRKGTESIRTQGFKEFSKRSAKYVYYKKFPERKKQAFKDILFVNGCALSHPERYRVHHQVEQLTATGLSVDSVFYEQLNPEALKYYQGFVFFRCPITDTVRDFITQAKFFNKTCFFDVDDLVIDTKYTNQIPYVQGMSIAEKALYDNGVERMKETLALCDYGITTTERLQIELNKYTKETFVNRNVASDEMTRCATEALEAVRKDESKVVVGYFSGSITHNDDFAMIIPSIVRLFKEFNNLYLKIVGMLDIPEELQPFKDRIINIDFMDWREMPREIATCDINIAPLVKNIFNEAKSENKWMEAALVRVATVASDIGAFKTVVKNNKTGILAKDNEWYKALKDLIVHREKREAIGRAAHAEVLSRHTTVTSPYNLTHFIRSKLSRSIAFVLPTSDISGGVTVALKHAEILRNDGWNVTLIDHIEKAALKKAQKQYEYRLTIPGHNLVVAHKLKCDTYFDVMVATLWSTLEYVKAYPNVKSRRYFVQGFETDFYKPGAGEPRFKANATYCDETGVEYLTMSPWCKRWLLEKFGKDAKYCSNGIQLENFKYKERHFKSNKKVKILIEGDSKSEYKNTDEAFRIVEKLSPELFEISYLSYHKEPKPWYRVNKFYNRIPHEKVGEVYRSCDILLKTSILESFSYPPLEMMATGGLVVVLPNEGNAEYVKDGENCLFYKRGSIEDAVAKVELLIGDSTLRKKLIDNGVKTAKNYAWTKVAKGIPPLYE